MLTLSRTSAPIARPTLTIWRVGDSSPVLRIPDPAGNRRDWALLQQTLAETFDCQAEDVGAPDVYFGGEYGDDDTADVVTVCGEIVASFERALTHEQVAAIYAADNSHANLRAPR